MTGEVRSDYVSKFEVAVGGTYARGKQDLDWERTNLKLSGTYQLPHRHRLQVKYTVYNFDNYSDPSPLYSQFYTANIVELNLIKDL